MNSLLIWKLGFSVVPLDQYLFSLKGRRQRQLRDVSIWIVHNRLEQSRVVTQHPLDRLTVKQIRVVLEHAKQRVILLSDQQHQIKLCRLCRYAHPGRD